MDFLIKNNEAVKHFSKKEWATFLAWFDNSTKEIHCEDGKRTVFVYTGPELKGDDIQKYAEMMCLCIIGGAAHLSGIKNMSVATEFS